MGKKIDVTDESFVSSVGEVKDDLAADVAAESQAEDEEHPAVCVNKECSQHEAEAPNGCATFGTSTP